MPSVCFLNSTIMKDSELVLANDGSLYHIHLTGEMLADDVILMGDPGRIDLMKELLDTVEFDIINRELRSVTGTYHGHRFTGLSTGMGCDNIDIVMTELDAAANMDLEKRCERPEHRTLNLIRLGSCGSLQAEIEVGTLVASKYALGLDGLINYYDHDPALLEQAMNQKFIDHMQFDPKLAQPYAVKGSRQLIDTVAFDMPKVITATAPGFYGPQGRNIRIAPSVKDLNERLASFEWDGTKVVNLEMETSAIYGLSRIMGHNALTICQVIANRATGKFINEYHEKMSEALTMIMDRLS